MTIYSPRERQEWYARYALCLDRPVAVEENRLNGWTGMLMNLWVVHTTATAKQIERLRVEVEIGAKPYISIPVYLMECAWRNLAYETPKFAVLARPIVVPRSQRVRFNLVDPNTQSSLGMENVMVAIETHWIFSREVI